MFCWCILGGTDACKNCSNNKGDSFDNSYQTTKEFEINPTISVTTMPTYSNAFARYIKEIKGLG